MKINYEWKLYAIIKNWCIVYAERNWGTMLQSHIFSANFICSRFLSLEINSTVKLDLIHVALCMLFLTMRITLYFHRWKFIIFKRSHYYYFSRILVSIRIYLSDWVLKLSWKKRYIWISTYTFSLNCRPVHLEIRSKFYINTLIFVIDIATQRALCSSVF